MLLYLREKDAEPELHPRAAFLAFCRRYGLALLPDNDNYRPGSKDEELLDSLLAPDTLFPDGDNG